MLNCFQIFKRASSSGQDETTTTSQQDESIDLEQPQYNDDEDSSNSSETSSASENSSALTEAEKKQKLEAIEKKNKQVGYIYLWFRFFEYFFRFPAGLAFSIAPKKLKLFQTVFSAIGYVSGLFGNGFQAEQGVRDTALVAKNYNEYKSTDKLPFSILAIFRGVVNTIADGLSFCLLFFTSLPVMTIAVIAGIATDVAGFVKNIRDVRKNLNGPICKFSDLLKYITAKSIAFMFCALSRPFLILGSAGLFLCHKEVFDQEDYLPYAGGLSILGMLLFNIGALIRQKEYNYTTDSIHASCCTSRCCLNLFNSHKSKDDNTASSEQSCEMQDMASDLSSSSDSSSLSL